LAPHEVGEVMCADGSGFFRRGRIPVKDEKTFGQRLRETRIRAGFSQSDLEEISGIPKARLSRYENGHVAPSIQTLERLARALNVSEASLLGDQRAILEEFFRVLVERGVRIATTEQGGALANAVADLFFAIRGDAPETPEQDEGGLRSVGLATVREWHLQPQ
jgi:transcriptional regulator with XRE-family HTH domain